jgi:DNA-binding CsgD family transcriptional regulator
VVQSNPGALNRKGSGLFVLTAQEKAALCCMARGLSLAEAGRAMCVAAGSVARYLTLARLAMGARTTAHAVAMAIVAGEIDVGSATELLGGSEDGGGGSLAGGPNSG